MKKRKDPAPQVIKTKTYNGSIQICHTNVKEEEMA